ncbi:trigger factor [Methylovirgula sp. HY1]|uniref:trigger factor n=1 Tax=Methylovirgula sp. HY1 TaxID=2822761 RepID=UPI001C5A8C79|nr:trigger factor [Methylovirgula sp. HY1]QXX76424.1 Trigger factor [Methylovirgula sp. HY1]
MQVTETLSEGLKREYKVVLAAADLATKVEAQLDDMRAKARINGFRPGKVPVAHLKRLYGRAIMADVMQDAVNEANQKIIADNDLKLATPPKIELMPTNDQELAEAFEAKTDLAYKVAVEILPKFEVEGLKEVSLERLVAEIPEADVEQAMTRIAEQNRLYTPKEGDAVTAAKGDKVVLDFIGKIGDEAFEGGTAQDVDLVLGSNSFIPGFEDQIEGMKIGEQKTISVSFPEDYAAANLAGKPATFEITLKACATPAELAIDDAFAQSLGFPDLPKMREAVVASLEGEQVAISRRKWKRELLDALDKKFTFELPDALVTREFETIWREATAERNAEGKSFAEDGTDEVTERADFQKIAERRVRLGLVLAEIGEKAGVTVAEEELAQALYERARNFPGMERQLIEFYRKNPERLNEIRAPLFEEKVVDHLLGEVSVTDKKVSPTELVDLVKAFEAQSETSSAAPAA